MEKYTHVKEIGKGNCSVHLVQNNHTRKLFAMKQIPISADLINSIQLRTAERETAVLQTLCHPCIVKCIESFIFTGREGIVDRDYYCIVMELCTKDLHKLIQEQRGSGFPFSEDYIRYILWQLISAVEVIHSKGYIHRDIKPQNVLVTTEGRVKLADFGLVKMLDADKSQATAHLIGTEPYIAPEFWKQASTVSMLVDIWSLGCLLYELIELRSAFYCGEDRMECMRRISEGRYAPIQTHVSEDLVNITAKMLNVDASARPNARSLLKEPLFQPVDYYYRMSVNHRIYFQRLNYCDDQNGGTYQTSENVTLPSECPFEPWRIWQLVFVISTVCFLLWIVSISLRHKFCFIYSTATIDASDGGVKPSEELASLAETNVESNNIPSAEVLFEVAVRLVEIEGKMSVQRKLFMIPFRHLFHFQWRQLMSTVLMPVMKMSMKYLRLL